MKNQTRLHITLHIYTQHTFLYSFFAPSIITSLKEFFLPFFSSYFPFFLFLLPSLLLLLLLLLLCFLFIEKEGQREVCVLSWEITLDYFLISSIQFCKNKPDPCFTRTE